MEFEVLKDDLRNYVLFAEKATGKNMSLPILNTILFTAKGNTITLHATNLDVGVEFSIPAKVIKEGSIAISGGAISSFVSTLSNVKKITCKVDHGVLHITTGINTVSLKTHPIDDFPTIPVVKDGEMFAIQSKKLIQGFKSVSYSTALNDIKPEFGGVYIYPEQNTLVFVATDTYRLAEKKIQEKNMNDFQGIIIPNKNIQEIIRVFEGIDDDISIVSNKNQVSFSTENIHISSRAVNTPFPHYQEIFPKKYVSEATILKQEIINALKVTTIFSDKSGRVTFKLDPKTKQCSFVSQEQNTGEQESYLEAVVSGEPVNHDYNYRYILECLQYIPQDSVILKVSAEGKLVIQGLGDNSFTYLVAPLMSQG